MNNCCSSGILNIRKVLETPQLTMMFSYSKQCSKFYIRNKTLFKLKLCNVYRDKVAIKINRYLCYKNCKFHIGKDVRICIKLSNGIEITPIEIVEKDYIYLYLDLVPLTENVCIDELELCISKLEICAKKCNGICKTDCKNLAFFSEIPCKLINEIVM